MGSWINLGGLKNDTTAPSTPVIAATAASSSEIDISLTTPSTDAGGLRQYVLERSPNGTSSWTTLAAGLSIFPYADTGLTSSTTYYYRCTASDFATNASVSGTVNAATTGSGADSFGITTYQFQSLNTGINNGISTNPASGFSASWDGTYAVLTWASGATAGLFYLFPNQNQTQVYVRLRIKAFQGNGNSKILKMKGPDPNYSNFTLGPQITTYTGTSPSPIGLAYSDIVGGGDNSTSWYLDGTLGGGGAYSRTPHPTFNTGIATNLTSAETLLEIFFKYNTDGTPDGEIVIWVDGVRKTWAVNVYNCGTGLQHMSYVGVGEYGPTPGCVEKYRDFAISFDRPTGRGI